MIGPALEEVTILRRDAEHLRDDGHRKRHREVGDDVDLAAGRELVQEGVGQGCDARPQLVDGACREGFVHQRAQARVIRRVAAQHHRFVRLGRIREAVLNRRRALAFVRNVVAVVGRKTGVAQHLEAVGVAEEDPTADGPAAVNRVGLAQTAVKGVRILPRAAENGIEDNTGFDAFNGQERQQPEQLASLAQGTSQLHWGTPGVLPIADDGGGCVGAAQRALAVPLRLPSLAA